MGLARTATPHLFSGVLALGLATAILFASRLIAIHLEHKATHAVAPRAFSLKNQAIAFQCVVARAQDVLPVYGSSEWLGPIRERAGVFFAGAPTGFQASPVGKVGSTQLRAGRC
jgi:poly-D-alanine transfer protein DltD